MFFKLLDDEPFFPDPALAEPDGLLAMGGDLSLQRLMNAYTLGIFPWFSEGEPILWYSPHERCVIFPKRIKVSKSMQKIIRTKQFKITTNTDFKAVIGHCAKIPRKGQNDTWITKDMQQAYLNLHQAGYAHSIEVWQAENLVGGLYGVQVNGVFCGESMFSLVSNASKTALVYLSNLNIDLIDCQLPNEHLLRLGAEMISREAYMHYLQKD